jgi:hypothetical protein
VSAPLNLLPNYFSQDRATVILTLEQQMSIVFNQPDMMRSGSFGSIMTLIDVIWNSSYLECNVRNVWLPGLHLLSRQWLDYQQLSAL